MSTPTYIGPSTMVSFGIDPLDVAKYYACSIDRDAGDSITHLKLQKLVYYAQAWSLVFLNRALFDEQFEAWAHGPVLSSVWEEYKEHGGDALPPCQCDLEFPDDVKKVLDDVRMVYGEKSARFLEDLTHGEEPWIEARGNTSPGMKSGKKIKEGTMRRFYTEMHEKLEAEQRGSGEALGA